uniref:Oxysterol-binding protein n=1 Tax=Acrobeloides nanus TaxID=290746 RepID=A0A914DW25_9BILA
MSLQTRLRIARRSIANYSSKLRRKRRSTIRSIDSAALLLKVALEQPLIEHAIKPVQPNDIDSGIHDDVDLSKIGNCHEIRTSLKELQKYEIMIQNQGGELVNLLTKELSTGAISRATIDRIQLFKMASGAMIDAAANFTDIATNEIDFLKNLFIQEREIRFKLEKENFELKARMDEPSTSRTKNRANTTDSTDVEFFDAIEGSFEIASNEQQVLVREKGKYQASLRINNKVEYKPLLMSPLTEELPGKFEVMAIEKKHQRRTKIPFRPSNSVNYLALAKHCVGKDPTKISMPVDFNEPLSVLQRSTEDLEYVYLLDMALEETQDPSRRLAIVAIFALSAYSTTGVRTTKPFNPLLGETYECDRSADFGWRSVAEQVSHHPPTCALYAEGRRWKLNQSYTLSTKIKGKSLCVSPVGSTYIRFEDNDDLFVYDKVMTATTMTNIVTGKLQTENFGDLVVMNAKTGGKCELKFHDRGYFSREEPRKVTGEVCDPNGLVEYRIEAIWDRYAHLYKIDSDEKIEHEDTIWTINSLPENSSQMHNFTKFAIELNEPEDGVASTDSRLRPDQRLMEDGDWSNANAIKQKLEEAQRVRRKEREEKGTASRPVWFVRKSEEEMIDKNDVYKFNDEYWRYKMNDEWDVCPKIFDY